MHKSVRMRQFLAVHYSFALVVLYWLSELRYDFIDGLKNGCPKVLGPVW